MAAFFATKLPVYQGETKKKKEAGAPYDYVLFFLCDI